MCRGKYSFITTSSTDIRVQQLHEKPGEKSVSKEVNNAGRQKNQVLDAFQQALEPIPTLYTGDFGVGRARSCPPIEYISSDDERSVKNDTHHAQDNMVPPLTNYRII